MAVSQNNMFVGTISVLMSPSHPTFIYVFLSDRIRTEFAILRYHFTFDNEICVAIFSHFKKILFLSQFRNKISDLSVLRYLQCCWFRFWETEVLQLLALQCNRISFKVYKNLPIYVRSPTRYTKCFNERVYSALILTRHVSDLTGPSSGAFCTSCIGRFRMW